MTVRELRDLLRGVPSDVEVTIRLPKNSNPGMLFPGQEVDVTKAGLTGDEDGLEVFRLTSEQFVR